MNAIMGEDIAETGDFIVNEKEKNINLTEDGVIKLRSSSILRTWQIRRTWRSSIISFLPSEPII